MQKTPKAAFHGNSLAVLYIRLLGKQIPEKTPAASIQHFNLITPPFLFF